MRKIHLYNLNTRIVLIIDGYLASDGYCGHCCFRMESCF